MILPSGRPERKPTSPVVASANGLSRYLSRPLGLGKLLEAVEDGREAGRVSIPLPAVLRAVVGGLLLGIGSMRGIEDRLRHSAGFRAFAGASQAITDDAMRDTLAVVGTGGLQAALYQMAHRALHRWRAGRYRESELARRLAALNASFMVAGAVVAIDGHETVRSERRHCADCQTSTKDVKRGGELVKVKEYAHKVVVAQLVGVHPAVVLDVEPIRPGEGEVTATYRLVARLGAVYGHLLGTLVFDALHDSEPLRRACQQAGYKSVVRHKVELRQPGGDLKKQLEARHPKLRERPDGWHRDRTNGCMYEYWVEQERDGGRFYVEVKRVTPAGEVTTGGLVTDLPLDRHGISPLVAGFIMERRWWIENTGFHELAGQFHFDRAFVHAGKPVAAWAMVLLTLVAYNVWQLYLYRHLGLDPHRPRRTWGDLRRDLFESLAELVRWPRKLRLNAWGLPP